MEGAEVVPAVARPGDEVRVKVRYSVLAPDPQATIPITETWQFLFKNQPAGKPIRKPKEHKAQGGYASTYKFKVTPDSPRTLPGSRDDQQRENVSVDRQELFDLKSLYGTADAKRAVKRTRAFLGRSPRQ